MPGVCPRCLREVYFAEEKLAIGKVWHTFCFSCRNCRKLLDSWTVATHSGELYCQNCHNRLFPTTSVRAALPPPIGPTFPAVDTGDLAVSPCESLIDCRCCCYCYDDCDNIDGGNGEGKFSDSADSPTEKQRLRGGGEDEELEAKSPLEAGGIGRSSDIEDSQLDAQSFVTTLCDPPLSPTVNPTAVTAWYNRHHSASQSTFSRPSSAQRPPNRPSSTPASGEIVVIRDANTCHCSCNRRPGSPCRTSHKHHRYSKPCHRNHCRGPQRVDKVAGSQEWAKFVKDYRGGNFLANYRNHLSPINKGRASSAIQSHHKSPKPRETTKNLITISSPRRKSCYPPLPPHYSPLPHRRGEPFSSVNECPAEDQAARYPAMRNVLDSRSGTVGTSSLEHSVYQDQIPISEALFPSCSTEEDTGNVDEPEGSEISREECRMRGGCGGGGGGSGGCCCSGGQTRTNALTFDHRAPSPCGKRHQQSDRISTVEGACGCSGRGRSGGCGVNTGGCCEDRETVAGGCCSEVVNEGACASKCGGSGRRPTGFESCPPRSPDPCSSDPSGLSPCSAGACSPPCSGRKGCCPPAGCRPVRRRVLRCNDTPCVGDSQSCGGGGCCGGGCRGGCGKPGQTCLPLRPCTIPPCQPHPRSGGSPCMPPRRCPPQPPCCRSPVLPGTPGGGSGGGGNGCCRSGSPGGRSAGGGGCSPTQGYQPLDDCCQPKLPNACECLGGGQDCQRCGRKVYQAEMQIASGVPYHNICFSCFCCRKPLETLTYHENCGEIYCKQCYVRNFGPQGYGYAGVLQTPM